MIRPLDLQTLYMNLEKVAKETAQSRDNVHNQQLTEGQKLTKEQELKAHSVGETDTSPEAHDNGSPKVKADSKKGGKKQPPKSGQEKNPEDPDGFTDDRLGRHIDLIG